ncbi:MAG: hypothetical protein ACW99A_21745, partial [Candidatus Kariarchaeaceae archaeon]
MDNKKNYKQFISIVEGIIFILLFITSILTIFDLISTQSITYIDIFNLWSLRIAIISFLLFLILPYLLIYFKKIGDKVYVKYNQQMFKNKFFEELKELQEKEINV